MSNKDKEYAQGYLEALEVLDSHIKEEMGRKGSLTPDKLLDVHNGIVAKLHVEKAETLAFLRKATYEQQPTPNDTEEMTALLQDLFGSNVKLVDIREFIIEGGIKL